MAPVGPQLPPSGAEKRKRDDDHDSDSDSDSSSDSAARPELPPQLSGSDSKKPRVIGPSLPPQKSTDSAEVTAEEDSDSSDDDDFGPNLPQTNNEQPTKITPETSTSPHYPTATTATMKRDDWMMVPPSSGDFTGRVDPTKLKNRRFNTGKGAKGPPSSRDAADSWHETPQEKQARLQREMMGIKDTDQAPAMRTSTSAGKFDAETAKRMEEYKKSRGPTLYDAHQTETKTEQDDDPSARAFDREKDIGGGLQINATQRRDMMKKASDFNSRFSSAKYL